MKPVEFSHSASPNELREAADIAEANANEAESERRRWQELATALRERAERSEVNPNG